MIYFDNAATTLHKPQCVIDAVVDAMQSMGNAGRGLNEASLEASRGIYDLRCKLAELFHADAPNQVAFTANATESLNIAIKGLIGPGDHVITTVMEHNSVLRPLYEMEAAGASLSFVGCDAAGVVDYDAFESLIRPDTKAVVCTHASNLTGNLVDIARIGALAHKHGLLFVVDASQTAGIIPIDMQQMQIDVLCFTGHKGLLGPQGTGGIAVRSGVCIRPLLSGGSGVQTFHKEHPTQMPTALEAGTLNGHGLAGLGAAVDYIKTCGMAEIRRKEIMLMRRFYEGIRDIPDIHFYGDYSTDDRCAIVAFNIGDYDSGEVGDELYAAYGVCVRTGGHCAPLMHEHFGTVSQGAVRCSFSHMNTEEEVDAVIDMLHEIC